MKSGTNGLPPKSKTFNHHSQLVGVPCSEPIMGASRIKRAECSAIKSHHRRGLTLTDWVQHRS